MPDRNKIHNSETLTLHFFILHFSLTLRISVRSWQNAHKNNVSWILHFPGCHTIFGHQHKNIKLGFFHLLAFWASSFSCFSNLLIFSNSLTFGELSPSNVIISLFKSGCCCCFNWFSNSVNMNQ